MERGKEVLKELYNFEGFSFNEIYKQNSVIIKLKKNGKTGVCPVCNKNRRKAIEVRQRTVRDMNFGDEKCFISFNVYRIRCNCGYRSMEKLDFVLPDEVITERFANYIYRLCEK